jgi:phage terminase small subunit
VSKCGNRMSNNKALTVRQERFVEEYLKDFNAARAARDAGYRTRGKQSGMEALSRRPVRAAIEAAIAARSQRARIDADRVIQELEDLALSDIGDIIDFSGPTPRIKAPNEIPERARRAISSMRVKVVKENGAQTAEIIEFKLYDKSVNLHTLMKHHGLLIDRVKVEDDLSEEELEARIIGALNHARDRKRAAQAWRHQSTV